MATRYRFNPPPNWPTPPAGWQPDRTWRKPPEWPEPPAGWQLWTPIKSHTGLVTTAVVGGVALILLVAGLATSGGGDGGTGAASTPSTSATRTVPQATHHARHKATAKPTSEPTEEPTTEPAKPKPHKHITTRKFRKIAKDPDSYIGKRVIIFGEVTQFDSATGPKTFLADSGAAKKYPEYGFVDYEQNSMFTGTKTQLGGIVQDDLVKVRATCLGSMDYDTQIGGQTTVPLFQVDKIKRYGSVDD